MTARESRPESWFCFSFALSSRPLFLPVNGLVFSAPGRLNALQEYRRARTSAPLHVEIDYGCGNDGIDWPSDSRQAEILASEARPAPNGANLRFFVSVSMLDLLEFSSGLIKELV